jgi:Putative HNHc nuclease
VASRCGPIAPPGTLNKEPRERDEAYLALIRKLPCVICSRSPCDAAHIRMGSRLHAKSLTGMGRKPSDKWALPICHPHHMEQHAIGERPFFKIHGIDPIVVARDLWAARPDLDAMQEVIRKLR